MNEESQSAANGEKRWQTAFQATTTVTTCRSEINGTLRPHVNEGGNEHTKSTHSLTHA